jgi:hypothetical protein
MTLPTLDALVKQHQRVVTCPLMSRVTEATMEFYESEARRLGVKVHALTTAVLNAYAREHSK